MHKLNTLILTVFIGFSGFAQTTPIETEEADTTNDQSNFVPAFTVDADMLETEAFTQDVSGLLQSSRDTYRSIAGFNFGAARYRIRGFGSENYDFLMNGIKVNDPFTNWVIFRYWGGLNDVTRYPENTPGIGANQWSFGGVGGTTNVNVRATNIRKTKKVSYALSNRSYNHRAILTYATGLMDNGFAVAFTGAIRYADEGYRPGTHYNAGSYFLSVEKKLNDKHTIGLVGFGAPTIQGKAGIAIQEAYDLTGDNYYNPYVGLQTDKETGERVLRNSRERNTHVPHLLLSHYYTPTDKTTLTTTGYLITGKTKNSRLDWNASTDPRPDYYKYFPSYHLSRSDVESALEAEDAWRNGDARYIDWDHLYFVNSKNLYTVNDVGGAAGVDETGNRSAYVIADDVVEDFHFGGKSNVSHILNENIVLSGGLSYSVYTGKFYREMNDLLGGDFWLDVNRFAERDFADPNAAQINLDEPNRVIRVGDKFGYNYELHRNNLDFFGQSEFKTAKVDGFIALNVANTTIWRDGLWRNGIYPDLSKGVSGKENFFTYGAKAGFTYKFSGRHYVTVNGTYQERPPSLRNSYLQPAWNGFMPNSLTTEKVMGGDLNYDIRYSKLKLKATVYQYYVLDQLWSRSFYHDALATFVNYSMSNVDHVYQGGELGFEVQATSTVKVKGAVGAAQYLYASRPLAYAYSDNESGAIIEETEIFIKNYHVGGTPETIGSLGLEYRSPKFWYVGADVNYFGDIYLEVNPDRRTEHALEKYITSDPQWEEMIGQTKLENGYTINAFAGKSWRINYKYFISLNLNVSNLLDVQDFQTGGFEQLRYDVSDLNKFPNKASYMYGRTFFAMVSFRF